MLGFIKRTLYALSSQTRPASRRLGSKWDASFSRAKSSCFDIKPEMAPNAKIEGGALLLRPGGVGRMTSVRTAGRVYADMVVEARFGLSGRSAGYCAAGAMFRVAGPGTYYLALVSNRGFLRLDAVRDRVPETLIGWTEIGFFPEDGAEIVLGVVARGENIILTVNGEWVAETRDASVPGGGLGFAAASYDREGAPAGTDDLVRLERFSLDSREAVVAREFARWSEGGCVPARSRWMLAETFAATGRFDEAHGQILKLWEQREEAIRGVTATGADVRTAAELLFAARAARRCGRLDAAAEHVAACASEEAGYVDGTEALAETALVMSAAERFAELAEFLPERLECVDAGHPCLPLLHGLLGHARMKTGDLRGAAESWETAAALDGENPMYATNASCAREMLTLAPPASETGGIAAAAADHAAGLLRKCRDASRRMKNRGKRDLRIAALGMGLCPKRSLMRIPPAIHRLPLKGRSKTRELLRWFGG